jgi:hypothetical protein
MWRNALLNNGKVVSLQRFVHVFVLVAAIGLLAFGPANAAPDSLIDASSVGDVTQVKALLSANVDVNARNNNGATGLMLASYNGHLEVVQALITANADVNASANNGATALTLASAHGHRDVVDALIAAKADVNAKTKQGATALIVAAQNGNLEVVEALLDAKADATAKASNGDNALAAATGQGNVDVMRVLIESQPQIGGVNTVEGDRIILVTRPDADGLLITAGWPRPLDELGAGECVLNIKSFAGGTITFDNSYAIVHMGGISLKTGPGGGAGVPMIAMPKPNKGEETFVVDDVGCEWRFPDGISFDLRGIRFAAQPGARVTFRQDGVRMEGIKVSGQ